MINLVFYVLKIIKSEHKAHIIENKFFIIEPLIGQIEFTFFYSQQNNPSRRGYFFSDHS